MRNTQQQDLQLKQERLQKAIRNAKADGCLVSTNINLYYLCGCVYNGYFYMPAEGEPHFFVKRPNDFSGKNIHNIRKPEQLPDLFKAAGIPLPEHLLLEADELSYTEYIRLQYIFNPRITSNATRLLQELRTIKTPWEIGQMRITAKAHALTYSQIPECYRPGMTDLELQYEIEYRMRKNGSVGFFRAFGNNMEIFMGSLLAGENAEMPSPFDFALGGAGIHPSSPLGANGTLLTPGTSVMIDMSGNYTAYQTDMTRVYAIGKLPEKAYKAHETSRQIQEKIIGMARPGTPCSQIYKIAEEIAVQAGLSANFMGTRQKAKFVGHGVGLQINEPPVLTPRSVEILSPGMTFALEPKFVIPGTGAVGIENTFLVTENGLEKITRFPEDIVELTK